jgi:hypothetical protein
MTHRGGSLKIRHDAVFVSSVLFTIAFLLLVPPIWSNAQAGLPFWHFGRAAQVDRTELADMGSELAGYAVLLGQCGVACLAFVLVVLIVIWGGYVKKLQWTWFVMFVAVWAWYFPLFVLPSLRYLRGLDLMMWLSSLGHLSSWAYNAPVSVLILLLMLVALILPVRFFFAPATGRAAHPLRRGM